jgi:hypothetical protein
MKKLTTVLRVKPVGNKYQIEFQNVVTDEDGDHPVSEWQPYFSQPMSGCCYQGDRVPCPFETSWLWWANVVMARAQRKADAMLRTMGLS